jgi:nitrite reductase/ring-hydroxylating ferredoxin subunit
MARRRLCGLDELADGDSKGFDTEDLDEPDIFLVCKGEEVFGYLNDCPHWNAALDIMPDRFLTRDKKGIQCSNHGARFVIETGKCTFGPCFGQSLTAIPIVIEDGAIWVEDYDIRLAARGEWRLTPVPGRDSGT